MNKLICLFFFSFCSFGIDCNRNVLYDSYCMKDTNSFNVLINQFANHVEDIWGFSEVLFVGTQDCVRYNHAYTTRSRIDFSSGKIVIETIASNNFIRNLREEIMTILLMCEKKKVFYLLLI